MTMNERTKRAMRARDELIESLEDLRVRDLMPTLREHRPVASRHAERIFALLDVLADFENDANTLGWDPLPAEPVAAGVEPKSVGEAVKTWQELAEEDAKREKAERAERVHERRLERERSGDCEPGCE